MSFPFAANLSFLFTDLSWERRFAAAAQAGFEGVEMNPPEPYQIAPAAFARRLADAGLVCPLITAPPGEGPARFGHACLPGEEDDFRRSVARMIEYATTAQVPTVHVLAGMACGDVSRPAAETTYVANIAWAAEQCADAGVKLCVEPVSERRVPGFFLKTTAQALELIARTNRSDIGLLFDSFHVEVQEGSAAQSLPNLLQDVVHVQLSDTPARGRPGTGGIDFDTILNLLMANAYPGWIACEYVSDPGGSDELDWARRWRLPPQADGSGVEA